MDLDLFERAGFSCHSEVEEDQTLELNQFYFHPLPPKRARLAARKRRE